MFVDLKAFERRLTDVISQVQPVAVRWRGTYNLSTFALHYINFNVCFIFFVFFL